MMTVQIMIRVPCLCVSANVRARIQLHDVLHMYLSHRTLKEEQYLQALGV